MTAMGWIVVLGMVGVYALLVFVSWQAAKRGPREWTTSAKHLPPAICPGSEGILETPLPIDDPTHWRRRAEEARRMVDQADDPTDKKALIVIAAAYEQLVARMAAKRDK